ncbi:conserved membrane hypothetical protein [uncultured Paludibacter sp.]|uniref:ABC3 transporter permease protein domain-containing protein n=1 Tax=uncultured Paludibacter sp. TaxID=497635 RepID=A0A653AEE5_9BACT|nr:conserved membrane hypothetical protein [uncultured Paludibacter sp.]
MDKTPETYQQDKWKFPFWIAKRYLFSKKSHNAINWISGISAAGVCVGTAALVCVLSVFNGFESLIGGMFSTFDPDLKISLVQGKTFETNTSEFEQIKKNKSIAVYTEVIEENALLRFRDKQMPATIKGVSDNFSKMTQIDSIMYDGEFVLNTNDDINRAVLGLGVASTLGVNAHYIDPLFIYAPKRTERINILNPENSFNQTSANITGIFSVKQAQYDDKYVLVNLNLARELFEFDKNTVSDVELKVASNVKIDEVKKEIQNQLGNKFKVQNRYEQQESFFKIMKIEKWITYLILCFILLIATFNIIGSLSMLIIDKKEDIITLSNLGAQKNLIKRIFLFEGWMISVVGAIIGIIVGTVASLLQQYFGFIKLGAGGDYVVNAYPVVVNFVDILFVFVTVLIMGFLAALYPVKYISTKNQLNLD